MDNQYGVLMDMPTARWPYVECSRFVDGEILVRREEAPVVVTKLRPATQEDVAEYIMKGRPRIYIEIAASEVKYPYGKYDFEEVLDTKVPTFREKVYAALGKEEPAPRLFIQAAMVFTPKMTLIG